MPLHRGSKLGCCCWLLGLLLLAQLADARWHKLHRARHSAEEDGSAGLDEYEEGSAEYRAPAAPRHRAVGGHRPHRGRRQQRQYQQFGESEDPARLAREQPALQRHRARGKRLSQRRHWTEKDKDSFGQRPLLLDNERREYELEVREAQNSSLCNYTVVPIPDPGGRIPRELEHVKCNHVGSRCQDKGTYCCIQTYRHVEVVYEAGSPEVIKVYSGCVCSLQIYGTLEPYAPNLEIND